MYFRLVGETEEAFPDVLQPGAKLFNPSDYPGMPLSTSDHPDIPQSPSDQSGIPISSS